MPPCERIAGATRAYRVRGMAPAIGVAVVAFAFAVGAVWARGDREVVLDIQLNTGGQVRGRILDGNDDVVVLECDGFPCAFGYDQLLPDGAYRARLAVLTWLRGGREGITAADHYSLGRLALRHQLAGYANRCFVAATKLDAAYRPRGAEARVEFREARRAAGAGRGEQPIAGAKGSERGADAESAGLVFPNGAHVRDEDAARRAAVIAGYKRVGEDIRRQVGSDLALRETEHFLIWTDWARAERGALESWCEEMYTSLARRFGVSGGESIFAGKCPVYCLRSRKRFTQVAGLLDHYDVRGALGYTSSAPNGHVHVVVCRQGGSLAARDAFASTLIHEGTHAFLHRYRSTRRIPMWLNEGLANCVAEAVLGDRCSNDRAAEAVGRAVVSGGYTYGAMFADSGMLDARYYAVAHGLVAHLIDRDATGLVGMIDDIKLGASGGAALEGRFGLTFESLDRAWRDEHR